MVVTIEATLAAVRHVVDAGEFGCRVVVTEGSERFGSAVIDADGGFITGSVPTSIQGAVISDALTLMSVEKTATLSYDEHEVFFDVIAPPPRLLIFGAVHVAQALVPMARIAGFGVSVADARAAFITEQRFPEADELLVGWPADLADSLHLDRRTFVVILSHDARYEDPLWPIVLPSDVRYIGAMGSRRTARARTDRLRAEGYTATDIARIHGPIGVEIGAVTPAEIAVSILAEVVAARYGSGTDLGLIGDERRLTKTEYLENSDS